jgi:hypothetical protein
VGGWVGGWVRVGGGDKQQGGLMTQHD